MPHFDDAQTLIDHLRKAAETRRRLHAECLAEKSVKPEFLIEVKNVMEHLRSALDYCARGLFEKYGHSDKANPKIYFPYANSSVDKVKFRNEIVNSKIPGLLANRADIVDMLESYQHFGNTGNWLPLFMSITNENKHEQLTPQVEKQYSTIEINATIPAGGTLKIDLTKIPLGFAPDKSFHCIAGTWTGLVFASTGVLVMPHLEHALQNVIRIVDELSTA